MKDFINEILTRSYEKGYKVEVIRRYLRMKYRINMDLEAIKSRIRARKVAYY
jgi:hypothetical protein